MNPPQKGYRPDIDGLRAISVLSVLAYHYRAPFPYFPLPGGFAGVDVFFVISGFLITGILTTDIAAGRFSIVGFYDRRIRRILPALLVMLAATLLTGKFLLMPGDYQALANSTAAAAFGVANIFFLNHTGYFDQAADLMPQLHTWSLAVEEQFTLSGRRCCSSSPAAASGTTSVPQSQASRSSVSARASCGSTMIQKLRSIPPSPAPGSSRSALC